MHALLFSSTMVTVVFWSVISINRPNEISKNIKIRHPCRLLLSISPLRNRLVCRELSVKKVESSSSACAVSESVSRSDSSIFFSFLPRIESPGACCLSSEDAVPLAGGALASSADIMDWRLHNTTMVRCILRLRNANLRPATARCKNHINIFSKILTIKFNSTKSDCGCSSRPRTPNVGKRLILWYMSWNLKRFKFLGTCTSEFRIRFSQ